MKTTICNSARCRFAGIIAIAAVIGLLMAGCDNPTGGGTPTYTPTAGLYTGTAPSAATRVAGVPANNVAAAVAHVNANPGEYTLLVGENTSLPGHTTGGLNASDASLTIIGIGGARTISLSSNGRMFTVGATGQTGISLTIGNNITLVGRNTAAVGANNNQPLVVVQNGASLTMNAGARITGNTTGGAGAAGQAGGVRVTGAGSLFTMNGGVISGNVAIGNIAGGAVRVDDAASFRMYGGYIENNEASAGGTTSAGGGVFITGAPTTTFTMLGGTIRNNRAPNSPNGATGVRVVNGAFRFVGGVIHSGAGAGANVDVPNATLMVSAFNPLAPATAHRGTIDGSGNWVQGDELVQPPSIALRGIATTIQVE